MFDKFCVKNYSNVMLINHYKNYYKNCYTKHDLEIIELFLFN